MKNTASTVELDAMSDELTRVYATRYYTQRDALAELHRLYRSGIIKADSHNNLPMRAIGKGSDWRIVRWGA